MPTATQTAQTPVQPLVADSTDVNTAKPTSTSEQQSPLPEGGAEPASPRPSESNPLPGLPATGSDTVARGSPTVQPVPLVNEAAVDPLLPVPTVSVGEQQAAPTNGATSTARGVAATIKTVPTSEWQPTTASQPNEGTATTSGSFELLKFWPYLVAGAALVLLAGWVLKRKRRGQGKPMTGQGYGGANAPTVPNMLVGGGSYVPVPIQSYTPPTYGNQLSYSDQPSYDGQPADAGERYELPDIYALAGATSAGATNMAGATTAEQQVMDDADAAAGDELPFWLQPPSQQISSELPSLSDDAGMPPIDTNEATGFGGAWQRSAEPSASTEVADSGVVQASSPSGWQPTPEEDDWLTGVGNRRLERQEGENGGQSR